MTARRRGSGFSLIEVMVAVTILSAALTWVVVGIMRNITAENHAKLMTTATFLARYKLNDIEDELYDKGFGEFEKDQVGTFEDRGFQRFGWKIVVDKVEMPSTDQVQTALGHTQDAKAMLAGDDPAKQAQLQQQQNQNQDPMTSSVAAMSSQFGMVKDVLESGIRRVTVTVSWFEGTRPYDVTVPTYYVDPKRVDQAINTSALSAAANAASSGGATGGGSSTPTTPSKK